MISDCQQRFFFLSLPFLQMSLKLLVSIACFFRMKNSGSLNFTKVYIISLRIRHSVTFRGIFLNNNNSINERFFFAIFIANKIDATREWINAKYGVN